MLKRKTKKEESVSADVQRIKDYQIVFGSQHGRRVLGDLMKTGHVLSSTFHVDQSQTLLREGERNMVLRIMAILQMNPADLLKRVEEEMDHE